MPEEHATEAIESCALCGQVNCAHLDQNGRPAPLHPPGYTVEQNFEERIAALELKVFGSNARR
jgi:hypothetical protein